MSKLNIGLAITGSFCTFDKILEVIGDLKRAECNILPIFSFNTASQDTRFYQACDFREKIVNATGVEPLDSIQQVEKIITSGQLDAILVAPCTGNTLSKIANAITDTPVLMAVKAFLRNHRPIVIGISTNDALGLNLKNIGQLMNAKNIYFVPFNQDNAQTKPNSIVADFGKCLETIQSALIGKQIQPIITQKME